MHLPDPVRCGARARYASGGEPRGQLGSGKETNHAGEWAGERQEKANLQFLKIAVCNIVGTPIRNRIELDTVRELHSGRKLGVAVESRLA